MLVIASGVNRVSPEKLARLLDMPVGRADAEAVKRHNGRGSLPLSGALGGRGNSQRGLPDEPARMTGGEVVDLRE